jgi:ribulose-5-phosphate 4-epimerase/fuculose-1-phosphate aldolase
MSMPCDVDDIHRLFKAVGAALMRVNANNTHSGNMSMRDPLDPDVFHVTASGSQCGELTPGCVVPLRFSAPGWSGVKPSTESGIHRRILQIPGARACVHCHPVAPIAMSLDSPAHPLLGIGRERSAGDAAEFLFQPADLFGAGILGPVTVGIYCQPVGSSEMELRIPQYLEESPVTVVSGHGPFARGLSPWECLHYLSVLDHSVTLAVTLRRRGVDLQRLQRRILELGFNGIFPALPRALDLSLAAGQRLVDRTLAADFAYWLSYNFNFGLGAFGTGSMSRKVSASEMAFCPMSAAPAGLDLPILRLPLEGPDDSPDDVRLHRLIYARTPFNACMLTASPLATAEAMAVLAQRYGIEALEGRPPGSSCAPETHPSLVPIDAEGRYLYQRLGLVDITQIRRDAAENTIPDMLLRHHGCCIIAGYGLISAAETSLAQAAHHVSSAERIARFRQEVDLNHRLFGGPPIDAFE